MRMGWEGIRALALFFFLKHKGMSVSCKQREPGMQGCRALAGSGTRRALLHPPWAKPSPSATWL